ncbi:MAG: hypothetical protein CMH57_01065 [Myxococcales bacterium]|nr:hypothetical protein [Myxococcales bacterium]
MTQSKPSRREALQILAQLGVLAAGGGAMLSACKSESKPAADKKPADKPADKPAAKAGGCEDLSGLSDADKTTRTSMKYVAQSTKAGQSCANCALYKAPEGGAACGSCTVVKGPIDPKGWCQVWAAKKA